MRPACVAHSVKTVRQWYFMFHILSHVIFYIRRTFVVLAVSANIIFMVFLIEVFKILTKYDIRVNLFREKQWDCITTGHSLKLVNKRCDLRKFSFASRCMEQLARNSNISRYNSADKFWQHQDILYDYKVELTGVGSRSQINADDNIVT